MNTREKYKIEAHMGARFGTRIVIGEAPSRGGARHWKMRCDCGAEGQAQVGSLFRGRARACIRCSEGAKRGAESHNWTGCGAVSGAAFANFKSQATKRGLPWELTIEDVAALHTAQNGRCALSGRSLHYRAGQSGKQPKDRASLDRKDSSRGYVLGNVQLTTARVNMAKQALSDEEFLSLCRDVAGWAERGEA